jgi:hypothetical protein
VRFWSATATGAGMRILLLSIVLSTGCHVVASTATTTVAQAIVDLVVDHVAFDAEFDATWNAIHEEHVRLHALASGQIDPATYWAAPATSRRSSR